MTLKRKTCTQGKRTVKSKTDSSCMTRTTIDNLDDNLHSEILLRLPAKTIAGLKVINKRWYSLISDPSFVNKHTSLQTNRVACSYFLDNLSCEGMVRLYFDTSSPNPLSETTVSLDLPEDFGYNLVSIIASCHGLLLVKIGNCIGIFNPLTKKKQLIRSHYRSPRPRCFFGLVFGPTSSSPYYYNHYNVVCLVIDYKMIKLKIFDQNKGRWRDSKKSSRIIYGNGFRKDSISEVSSPVCFRGIIYWLTRKGLIIAFDLDKEESKLIEIPKSLPDMKSDFFSPMRTRTWFGVIEDEVNLVVVALEHEIVIWVLDDYENNKWKLKRKDVIQTEVDGNIIMRSLFFNGVNLVLFVSVEKNRFVKTYRHEHDIQTGISGPLHSAGKIVCFPYVSTLAEVSSSN